MSLLNFETRLHKFPVQESSQVSLYRSMEKVAALAVGDLIQIFREGGETDETRAEEKHSAE